jgi:hypothetical protein
VRNSVELARVRLGGSRLFSVMLLISALASPTVWSQAAASKPIGNGAPPLSTLRARPMFGAQPVHKIPQNKDGSRALPDDPLAAFQADTTLPPYVQNVAPFVGNFTIVTATPGNGMVMARELDCSLTAFNVPYTTDPSGPYNKADSKTIDYNQVLHNQSGVGTTGGNFGGHCPDPSIGINSSALIYAGTTTGGMRVGALAAYYSSVGHNVLITVVTKTDGTFVSTTQQPLATNDPFGVVAADLNGDGNPDLVAVGYVLNPGGTSATPAMTVLLGKPDGSFTVGQTYPLPDAIADSVVIDDFNGDGKLDVVVPTRTFTGQIASGGTLLFFPGNGNGTFGTTKTQSLTTAAENLISGDFNGDGKKDLVSGTGVIFLGHGDGTFALQSTPVFSAIPTNSSAFVQLAAGDFNKDGKLDLAGGSGNSIYIFLGNGDGTFKTGPAYTGINNQGYLAVADLDGDGNLDLFSGDAENGIFGGDEFTPNEGYAMMGRGDGTFTGAPEVTTQVFNSLEDLNGDGKLDFIGEAIGDIADSTKPIFSSFYGHGDGTFQQAGASLNATNYTYQGTQFTIVTVDSFATADLNGDKHYDLIYIPSAYDTTSPKRIGLLTAFGNPDGSFQSPVFTPAPSLAAGITGDYPTAIGDVHAISNAAGKTEILYSYSTGYVTGSTGTYNLGYATQLSNGDGTFATPALTIYSTSSTPQSASLPPALVAIADLNNDKTPDLIIYVPTAFGNGGTVVTPPALQIMLGNADGTFGKPINVSAVVNPTMTTIAVGDVNGDGIPDLVAEGEKAVNGTNDFNITVAIGKGDGTFHGLTPMQLANGEGFESFAIGDFTGDGKADIAMLGFQPGLDSGLFPGNGDGTFQSIPGGQSSDGTVMPALPILVSTGTGLSGAYDINGDGKIDLLGSGTFLLQSSSGGGTSPGSTETTLSASASTVAAGQNVTLTATVAASSGSGTPTGTVTFLDGMTSLGTGTLNASGVATFSTASLAVGVHLLTASYGGATNFSASTSTAVSLTVTSGATGDFTVGVSPSTASVTAGASAAIKVSVAPSGGFNQAVSFACSGLPANSTCSFSPATVTPSGTAAATTTLTISTDVMTSSSRHPGSWEFVSPGIVWSVALFGLGGLLSGRRRWRQSMRGLQILCVMAILFHLLGCGGSSSDNKTPGGTSTVTVTASAGSTSHTATVTLKVQ